MPFDRIRKVTKIVPFGQRLKVRRDIVEEVTDGGLYLPATSEKLNSGEVVEVGTSADLDIPKGCFVIFNEFAGIEVMDNDGEKYVILEEKDIIAFEAEV